MRRRTQKKDPHDSPTAVRRTASVCPVGARPRGPPRAAERTGAPSWIPAGGPWCRGDGTLRVGRLSVASFALSSKSSLLWNDTYNKCRLNPLPVASRLRCGAPLEEHPRPLGYFFPPGTVFLDGFCLSFYSVQSWEAGAAQDSLESFRSALRKLGASCLEEREVGRPEYSPPTPPPDTRQTPQS